MGSLSLKNQLAGMGFASEVKEEKRKLTDKEIKAQRYTNLYSAISPDTFRTEARKLLLSRPGFIQEIIDVGHSIEIGKMPNGGARLNRDLYAVRDLLNASNLTGAQKFSIVDENLLEIN